MSETTTEIAVAETMPVEIVNVETGEALTPTIENAALVLDAARRMKDRIADVIVGATAVVVEEARVRGSKTFHLGDADVKLSGGPSVEYDPEALRAALREADCPEDRIDACIRAEITYKVDRSVLRQLTGANEDYKAAAELAERPIFKNYSAKVERR